MRKKMLLAAIGVSMLAIFLIGGAPLETTVKNYSQFVSFLIIAVCVYLIMKEAKEEK